MRWVQTLKGIYLLSRVLFLPLTICYIYIFFPIRSFSVFSFVALVGGKKPPKRMGGTLAEFLSAQHVGDRMRAMDTLDFWTPADALAFRCSVSEVGTLKAADAALDAQSHDDGLRADVREARLHAPRAFRALVRLMEGDNERVALGAAKEILQRAYGDPLQPVPAPVPAALPSGQAAPELAHPDWLDRQRLAYRAGEYESRQ